MSKPTVSVIMACYNGATLIGQTIDSVLAQGLTDFELIVVDDCSTDGTREVVGRTRDPRLRLLSTPQNMGPARARNLAVAYASGRYLAAWDQDDLCDPTRLARQVAFLDANRAVVAAGTASRVLAGGRLRPDGRPARTTPEFIRWMMHVGNPLVWSSMMIRGEAARALVPFSRDDRRYAEDFDLYHRLAGLGDVARLDEVLTTYRSHAGGASQRHRAHMQASAQAVLAEAYAPWFGARADECAVLVSTYLAGRQTVPDLATLDGISGTLAALTDACVARHAPDAQSRALIAREMSRQWWRAARDGIRTGKLGLASVLNQRPDFADTADFGVGERIASGITGWVRGWMVSHPPLENGHVDRVAVAS